MLLLLVGITFLLGVTANLEEEQFTKLLKLKALREADVLTEAEYVERKNAMVDEFLGSTTSDYRIAKKPRMYSRVNAPNNTGANWTMPKVFTPQVDWLVYVFNNNMPRSYDDILPTTGKSYWRSHDYLTEGAMNYNGTRLPLDSEIAIQERALTHVGLNLYDGGVWAVALTLNGLVEVVDAYHRNVLFTSSTGSNPTVNGLKSIRAWEPNPDPIHPPDLFYYGVDQVPNTDLPTVQMPNNLSFVLFKEGCNCPSSGCCAQIGKKHIPGNFFYRMIGPTYLMSDPLEGMYNFNWRAEPIGTNPDKAQWWNGAGVIHWNDWKPITGENVWGGILAPMQVLLLRNCTHVKTFATFDKAPAEVQLAASLMPAAVALKSPLGSMYHCPKGTKMFPPDPSEQTNVSNENNFSAWSAFKAFYFVLDTWYTGSDETLDKVKSQLSDLITNLDHWFDTYLLPAPLDGEIVVSQGGHVSFAGEYQYQTGAQAFAVDCQTWGMLVYGSRRFDAAYGSKQTAYGIWQATKKLAGYYVGNNLAGVGYTTILTKNGTLAKPDIWSGEWTWGAVFMTRKLAYEYKNKNPAWSASLLADSASMVTQMKIPVQASKDGVWEGGGLVQVDGSYLYANKRFFIPWGWYANPLGATSSTGWAVFDSWNYDPFTLGGFFPDSTFWTVQCMENPPDKTILDKLATYYNYM